MNYSNYSQYRDQYVHTGTSRPVSPATYGRPFAPQPSARGGYGSGFCDGFCDGIGKFVERATQVLSLGRLFR